MEWWVLKNRRHEGPYSKEALGAAVTKGRFNPEDYALSHADSEAGKLNYVPLKKVLDLAIAPKFEPVSAQPESVVVQVAEPLRPRGGIPADTHLFDSFEINEFVPVSKAAAESKAKSEAHSNSAPVTTTTTALPAAPVRSGGSRAKPLGFAVLALGVAVWMNPEWIGMGNKPGEKNVRGSKPASVASAPASDAAKVTASAASAARKNRASNNKALIIPSVPEDRSLPSHVSQHSHYDPPAPSYEPPPPTMPENLPPPPPPPFDPALMNAPGLPPAPPDFNSAPPGDPQP